MSTTYTKPSEFLATLDSHGIYTAEALAGCKFDTSTVPRFTRTETEANIRARGLGGQLNQSADESLIYGWTTASALARAFLGESPGGAFFGRGSAFRADLDALRKAGH